MNRYMHGEREKKGEKQSIKHMRTEEYAIFRYAMMFTFMYARLIIIILLSYSFHQIPIEINFCQFL